MRFDVSLVLTLRAEGMLDDTIGGFEASLRVAAGPLRSRDDVGVEAMTFGLTEIGIELRVQHRCLQLERIDGIENRLELFVLNLYHRHGILGDVSGFRGNRGDLLTGITDDVLCQRLEIAKCPSDTFVGQIGTGQHRVHAGHELGCVDVDRNDARIRKR